MRLLKGQSLKVIVYEHVSGGGYACQPIPSSVLCEGFGMLRSIVSDFKLAGHEVTVFLDSRISKLNPQINADATVPIFFSKEPENFLKIISAINDAIYVIAPETGRTLQSLVELVEKTGKNNLNCESQAIGYVSDKAVLFKKLLKAGFPTPKTLVLNHSDSFSQVNQAIKQELSFPVIFKPIDGVGCSGLSKVNKEAQMPKAIAKIIAESKSKMFIVQEFISGEPASVCLLSNGKKALAISLNKQNVTLAHPNVDSSYNGGCVPYYHPLKQEAFALTEKVVESIPGLRGYVGVDLIFTSQKIFVVDVNPRLTTSYVGLRKVASYNVAEALVDSVLKNKLPTKPENHCFVCYSKIETSKPTINAFKKAAKLDTVITPPFPLEGDSKSSALVIGEGNRLDDAKLRLEEAKKHLLNIIT
jgi:predicted ATP-grasp superfamily ATP-dependent carboligase